MKHRRAELVTFVWRRVKPLHWRLLRLRHATFLVATQALVRDGRGRVLILRHRMWPPGREWGLPGGYADRGEQLEDAARREVREETGLAVDVSHILRIRSGFRYRIEVAYAAELGGGELRVDPTEILEARYFTPDDLPAALMPEHRRLIELNAGWIRAEVGREGAGARNETAAPPVIRSDGQDP